MPKFKPSYIKEWRKFRDVRQEDLANAIDMSAANLSRIENGQQAYSQEHLESAAKILECTPIDLISRNPADKDSDELLAFVTNLPAGKRKRALRLLKVLEDEQVA